MTSVLLYVGIAVTFLTMWGVIMVGGYLLGRETDNNPTTIPTNWITNTPLDTTSTPPT